ncbi:MAG: undecaprenyl-diphosphatase UppP [Anaerolineales bacterium]|nr:MAG: undecaprenyl-diphosphatase UppP [Anaerolineales bacterium]
MNLFQAALLGIVQGLTEFLPISSSGHLILARNWLGLPAEDTSAFVFDVLIQLGTWLAVLAYFRKDLLAIATDVLASLRTRKTSPNARLGWLVLLSMLPAVIVGWFIKDSMETFSSLTYTGIFLIVNALLLVAAEWLGKKQRQLSELTATDAVWIGVAQIFALLPAVSRSASTLFGGMLRNLDRRQAARFAFLMSVPIMPAAGIVALMQLGSLAGAASLLLPLAVGFTAAAIVGYIAIDLLLRYLATHSFYPFAIYCTLLGLGILLLQ